MGRIFMISDTHFGDNKAIIRYEGRPFQESERMDELLIENWNRTAGPEDTVYHLGDVADGLGKEELASLLGKLSGRKILVMGNHDQNLSVREWMEAGFEEVYPLPVILDGYYMLSHEPLYVSCRSPYANVFGHVHGNPSYRDKSLRSYCVCVERTGYCPVAFDQIREEIAAMNR